MRVTDDERIAKKIGDLVSDLRVDLEAVAIYISQLSPKVTINRILLMAEILKEESEQEKPNYDYEF
jgi:hypothetical protein